MPLASTSLAGGGVYWVELGIEIFVWEFNYLVWR